MAKRHDDAERTRRALDRALAMPVFTQHETCVMQAALELAYTAPDGSAAFRLNPTRLMRRRGLVRECASRAIGALLADGVLAGSRERTTLEADYRLWRGRHALSEAQVAECEAALEGSPTDCGDVLDCDPTVTPARDSGVTVGAESVTQKSHSVARTVTGKSHSAASVTVESHSPGQSVTVESHPALPPSVSPPTGGEDSLSLSPPKPPTPADSTAPIGGTQQFRADADLAYVRQAEALLASELATADLAMALGREHNLPGMREVPGWKWLVAARKILGPGINASARRSFKYLAGIAANVGDDEWAEPVEHAPEPPKAPAAARNGTAPHATVEVPPTKAALRRRAQTEAMRRAIASLPEDVG